MKAAFEAFGKMEACDVCREYVAVMRIVSPNKKENKNLCINCAFNEGLIDNEPELQKALAAMGITRENAENFNTRVEDFEEMFPDGDMSSALNAYLGPEYTEKIAKHLNVSPAELEQKLADMQANGKGEQLFEMLNDANFMDKDKFQELLGMVKEAGEKGMSPDAEMEHEDFEQADFENVGFNPFAADNSTGLRQEEQAEDAIDALIHKQLADINEKLAKPNQQLAELRAKLAAGSNVDPYDTQLDRKQTETATAAESATVAASDTANKDEKTEGDIAKPSGMLAEWQNNPPQLGRFNPFIPESEQRIGQPLPQDSNERLTTAKDKAEDDSSSEQKAAAKDFDALPKHAYNAADHRQQHDDASARQSGLNTEKMNTMKLKYLDKYAMNLNQKMLEGKIDILIDREEELARVIQILNRRSKNNPVLLGEPGVGKTAIAEGLAWAIVKGQVPGKLQDFQVYLLDMTALVAGTQFRGQFETRLKGVVDEVIKVGKIILVIDELHNIMGAGNAEGAMNAANILKPALARGELRVLGSTTLTEYRKTIEKDSALERRFQPVIVEEPDKEATLKMLFGKRPYLEEHHYVVYDDEVCRKTVEFADRYVNDRFFPDKAIDILDEAGSKANLKNEVLTAYQKALKERDTCMQVVQRLEDMAANNEENTESIYVLLAENKSKLAQIKSQIDKLKEQLTFTHITVADIAAVIEQWTGIPVKNIDETETERLLHLEERLHERVIGQNDAISALAKAIKRQRVGLGKRKKPASFIFVGPTGVGKTELVKALAQAMFDAEDAYIRLDMSEYMEAHTVSKMIGSPPGYVGYDDGGQLTEKVRRHPYSVILLDEIEKAHQDVFNILLQILDEGRLTDSHGRQVSFQNTIIIMTSNAGTSLKSAGIGFGNDNYTSLERKVDEALREIFKPEFLNRVDEIVVFRPLQASEIREIIELMLKEINEGLETYNMQLSLALPVMNLLAALGYDEKYGARPLRKVLSRYLEDSLADFFLLNKLHNVKNVQVKLSKDNSAICEDYAQLIKLSEAELVELAKQLKFYADNKLIK